MRKRYSFRGTVQHVGFRYRAIRAAGRRGCTGWVKNLPDGSVLMEAQGEEADLEAVRTELCTTGYGSVTAEVTEIPEETGEIGFSVRF